MLERDYQSRLIKRLKEMFPGCMVLKNDADYIQGIPDLLVLIGGRWAALEVKPYLDAPEQPNQRWYIEEMDAMSFAAFISPEVEEEVLYALQRSF